MKDKRRIGFRYEAIAKNFLKKMGYDILKTNFYTRKGEIDIIAYDKDYLCFIEVKYRGKGRLISGFEAVGYTKQKKIMMASKYYLYKNHLSYTYTKCRFDVVSIDGDTIRLLKNAFP